MKRDTYLFLVMGFCAVVIGLAIFYDGGDRPATRDPNTLRMHIVCSSEADAVTAREAIIAGPSVPVGAHDCIVGATDVSMRDAQPIGMFNDYEGNGTLLFQIKDGRYGFITSTFRSALDIDGYVDINDALDRAVAEFTAQQQRQLIPGVEAPVR